MEESLALGDALFYLIVFIIPGIYFTRKATKQ